MKRLCVLILAAGFSLFAVSCGSNSEVEKARAEVEAAHQDAAAAMAANEATRTELEKMKAASSRDANEAKLVAEQENAATDEMKIIITAANAYMIKTAGVPPTDVKTLLPYIEKPSANNPWGKPYEIQTMKGPNGEVQIRVLTETQSGKYLVYPRNAR